MASRNEYPLHGDAAGIVITIFYVPKSPGLPKLWVLPLQERKSPNHDKTYTDIMNWTKISDVSILYAR